MIKLLTAALAAFLLTATPVRADTSFGSGLPHDPWCYEAYTGGDWGDAENSCREMADEAHAKAVADPKNAMSALTVEAEAYIMVAQSYLHTGDKQSAWNYAHMAWTIGGIVVETMAPACPSATNCLFGNLYATARWTWIEAAELERIANQ